MEAITKKNIVPQLFSNLYLNGGIGDTVDWGARIKNMPDDCDKTIYVDPWSGDIPKKIATTLEKSGFVLKYTLDEFEPVFEETHDVTFVSLVDCAIKFLCLLH